MKVYPISLNEARAFIKKNHYAKILPPHSMLRLACAGCVAVWGYGVRPADTIRIILKDGQSKEYLELCRLCCEDRMPRNTESGFLSACANWITINRPEVLLLWSWADGMRGKPGFVYQASGWTYCRELKTAWYTNGESIMHPRFFVTRYGSRRAAKDLGYQKVHGIQYGYYRLIGSPTKRRETQKRILLPPMPYPKETSSVVIGSVDWNLRSGKTLFN